MFVDIAFLIQLFLVQIFRIAIVVVLGWAIYTLLKRLVPRVVTRAVLDENFASPEGAAQRRQTLSNVLIRAGKWALWVLVGFTILGQIGVNLAPFLAGAGVAGIAIGFGAQSLVRDIIRGMAILLEDQYRVGEVARVAGIAGLVEDINIRRTVLRDLDGTVHFIPNGEITTVSNLTRQWARVHINIGVGYGTDIEKAREVINRIGREMAEDPYFGPLITEPPHFERVDGFEDSGVAIKILGVTRPIRQWEVMGEMRKRIVKEFPENGIEIPFPHRVVIMRDESGDKEP